VEPSREQAGDLHHQLRVGGDGLGGLVDHDDRGRFGGDDIGAVRRTE
jgi:hypothetical protein